jgi:acyl-CoA synthetase (AMP-forming)/AMP-acid ligase II
MNFWILPVEVFGSGGGPLVPFVVPGADDGGTIDLGQTVDMGDVKAETLHALDHRGGRCGTGNHHLDPPVEHLMVADPASLAPVPADGATMGEIFMRGNFVMKGYVKNPGATEEAFAGGWFHSGDLGVMHPEGYIELKDRSKEIIISGGENISTIEVEDVLYRHPAVLEAAVVARSDPMWGETPCAFVTLKPETEAAEGIIAFCRRHLAHFKAPWTVIFGPSSSPTPRRRLAKPPPGAVQRGLASRRRHRAPGGRLCRPTPRPPALASLPGWSRTRTMRSALFAADWNWSAGCGSWTGRRGSTSGRG